MPFKDGKHPGGRPREPQSEKGLRRRMIAERAELAAEARQRILEQTRMYLTRELLEGIIHGIKSGNYAEVVARSLGINEHTYRGWVSAGEKLWLEQREQAEPVFSTPTDPEGLRVELYLRQDIADAEWEAAMVELMSQKIADGSYWAGMMTILQRRHPERWNDRGRATQQAQSVEDLFDEWARLKQVEASKTRGEIGEGWSDVVESTAEEIVEA